VALRRHATCPRRQPRPRPHQEAGAVAAAPRDVIDRSRGLCGRARLQPKASPKGCRFDRGERHANAKNPLPLSPQALLAAAVSHDEGTRSSAEATPSALNPSTSPSPSSHSSLLFHPHRHPMARSAEAGPPPAPPPGPLPLRRRAGRRGARLPARGPRADHLAHLRARAAAHRVVLPGAGARGPRRRRRALPLPPRAGEAARPLRRSSIPCFRLP
jgi:hypothetical protein